MTAQRQTSILIGADADRHRVSHLLGMSNRHGLVAGATGTGKTVTLQVLAEGFSRAGVPVFAVDVKGDLSGIAAAGNPHPEIDRRLGLIDIPGYQQRGCPTVMWDIYGEQGHPVRTTISEMGPLILGNLLTLNDTQSGILHAAFSIADDEGLLLLDIKDLRSLLNWMSENSKDLRARYGNISSASVGAIARSLLVLEEQGADRFFGEPALDLRDLMRVDFSGQGVVNLLRGDRLLRESPKVYAAFLLWLLSELFEDLPELGDPEKPGLVLFFDEAHLLFDDAPKALLDKIEQVVRLIRSKGVGVYFVTQSPLDLPQDVLGQLGLKVEHALRAFTPKDRRTIRAVAESFRSDGDMDVAAVLSELERGEALVSSLDSRGAPVPVSRTLIRPPESRIGPLSEEERSQLVLRSPVGGRYDEAVDRESAHEKLLERARQRAMDTEQELAEARRQKDAAPRSAAKTSNRQSVGEALMKSVARSVGSSLGRRLVRGLLGSLLK
ncbi:MAG: helicase HerA-like domain-containing protein [Pseudomonadales bacterium]